MISIKDDIDETDIKDKKSSEVKTKIKLSVSKIVSEVLDNTAPELLKKIKSYVPKNEETNFLPNNNENLDIFNDRKFFIEDCYKKNKDIIDQKNRNKIYQIPLNYHTKTRSWCLTIFSLPDIEPKFIEKDMKYLVYGSEIASKTKKHHFQTYVYFHNVKTFLQVRTYFFKLLGFSPHIEKTRGSIEENLAYCSKDEKYKEFGKKPSQGERSDIKATVDDIIDGKN
jgi:hypothetical protein